MAITPDEATLLTFDDARQLSDDEFPGELEGGEWFPVTRPTPKHGRVMARVGQLLMDYLDEHPVGEAATGDPGVELARDPDTLRGPDVMFVSNERLPVGGMPDDWLEFSPDLAVEIISKSQSPGEAAGRARDYLAAGSRLAWVVNPRTFSVTVFTPDGRARTLPSFEELDGGDVLPGFRCKVSRLFD